MIRVLVTGAGSAVGLQTIKYLLSEGKYEITALDFKNSKTVSSLKKYKKRINIIYGDICDRILIEALIKDHDFVIYLSSVPQGIGSISKELVKSLELNVIENLVRSINYYNPNCSLFYTSTTSVYGTNDSNISIKNKVKINNLNYLTVYKRKCENLIKEKCKKYTIVRLPLLLDSNKNSDYYYQMNTKEVVNVITSMDAGYAFVKLIDMSKEYNKKTINIASNDKFNIAYNDLIKSIISARGMDIKYILSKIFMENNNYSPVCSDIQKFNDDLNYQIDSYDNFYERLKRNHQRNYFSKLIGKIVIKFWR